MKLREWRVRRVYTVRALAKGSGVSEGAIRAIEAGKWGASLNTVSKVSKFLGIDPLEVEEFRAAMEKRGAGLESEPPETPRERYAHARTVEERLDILAEFVGLTSPPGHAGGSGR